VVQTIRKVSAEERLEPVSLGELIHQAVRGAIELAVHEELAVALGADVYERGESRRGYRNGQRPRTISGPTGPVALTVPRATLFSEQGKREWSSGLLPRYQRRLPELNQAIVGTYLSGSNTRRIKGALKPLLKAAPLSKSAVSRVVSTLQSELETWHKRPLSGLEPIYLYLDALRAAGAQRWQGGERAGAGRGGDAGRREQATPLAGDVRERVARGVEGASSMTSCRAG